MSDGRAPRLWQKAPCGLSAARRAVRTGFARRAGRALAARPLRVLCFRPRGHRVMHVVLMVMHVVMWGMVVVVMMVVMHLVHFARGRGGRRSGFLSDGVTGEPDRESGGCENALDHGRTILR